MTRKTIFALQIIGAVLVIIAMIYLAVYAFEVFIPKTAEQINNNTNKDEQTVVGVFWVAMGSGIAIAVVAVILAIFAFLGAVVGVYMLVLSLVLHRKKAGRVLSVVLHAIAQALILAVSVFAVILAVNSGLGFLPVAVTSCVGCILWAVQFFAIASHINVSKQINTHD